MMFFLYFTWYLFSTFSPSQRAVSMSRPKGPPMAAGAASNKPLFWRGGIMKHGGKKIKRTSLAPAPPWNKPPTLLESTYSDQQHMIPGLFFCSFLCTSSIHPPPAKCNHGKPSICELYVLLQLHEWGVKKRQNEPHEYIGKGFQEIPMKTILNPLLPTLSSVVLQLQTSLCGKSANPLYKKRGLSFSLPLNCEIVVKSSYFNSSASILYMYLM